MFYIHQTSCISSQHTFDDIDLEKLEEPVDKLLVAIEPTYDLIPAGVLRRMGKAVRMGVGAAMPLFKYNKNISGILIGTANSGKEDCVKFLNQIIDYEEGMLTPLNFVQGTPNSVAAQIGLLSKNHGYNISHVHLGLAFEFAAMDVAMLISEHSTNTYLLGAVDDVSASYYFFEDKSMSYKEESISNLELYKFDSPGSIAGEAATMFLVNGNALGAKAKLLAVETIHSTDEAEVMKRMSEFIAKNLSAGDQIDMMLTGENGDNRLLSYYTASENVVDKNCTIARFKHMSGEYPTASAMGVWLSCEILERQSVPQHMIKRASIKTEYKCVLIYNIYKGNQHSFILMEGAVSGER